MYAYIVRRLALIIPTMLGIMIINFVVIQAAPGGPVEQMIAEITGTAVKATARISGDARAGEVTSQNKTSLGARQSANIKYRGSQGLPPELIVQIEKQFGFDKPAYERFIYMMGNYIRFDFGDSFFRDKCGITNARLVRVGKR